MRSSGDVVRDEEGFGRKLFYDERITRIDVDAKMTTSATSTNVNLPLSATLQSDFQSLISSNEPQLRLLKVSVQNDELTTTKVLDRAGDQQEDYSFIADQADVGGAAFYLYKLSLVLKLS